MTSTSKRVLRIVFAGVGIASSLCLCNGSGSTDFGLLMVKPAQAYIGNPLTPMSYAGVARRTVRREERRDYYYGGGNPYGGGYPPPYGGYPPPGYAYGRPYP